MKTLSIIRHAKSSWSDLHQADFDRPLNARGQRAAPELGDALKARGYRPDYILSSPALRAISTAKIIAEALAYPLDRIALDPAIYEASLSTLLGIVARLPDAFDAIMMFGHNPGFFALANALSSEPIHKMPTGAVVTIDFVVDRWADVALGKGTLKEFLCPKEL